MRTAFLPPVAALPLLALLLVACGSGARGQVVRVTDDAEVALARDCVRAGEEQTLEVRAPHPAIAVYEVVYNGGVAGGSNSEIVPESGLAELSWTAASEAPAGPAVVNVGLLLGTEEDDRHETTLSFGLAAEDGKCS